MLRQNCLTTISYIFLITFSFNFLAVSSFQLICDTKNETCKIRTADLLESEDLPRVNFSFILDTPENVTQIRFENSEISEIPKLIFERFVNLQVLDLKFCALKRFRKVSLENAHNLIEIDLSYNKLKRLEEGLFSVCTKLITLNLFRNNIIEVNEKAFGGLSYLEKLTLASNEIRRFKMNVFKGLASLTELDLKKNRIESIDGIFDNLPQLEILELSFNKIKTLNATSFLDIKFLEILDLSNNRIESIDLDAFRTNLHLKALNLANNKLQNLDLMIFSASFKILDCQNNALTYLNLTSGLKFAHEVNTSINAENNFLEEFSVDPKFFLTKLSVASNNFSSINFLSKCCNTLTWLDFSLNPLNSTDEEDELEIMSKSLTYLKAQNVSYIQPTAIDTIMELFTFTPQLEELDISLNNFHGIDFKLLPTLTQLSNLTAKNCSITEQQVDEIQFTFPNVKFLYFYGNPVNCDEVQAKFNATTVDCSN